jgi:hypothetical protein
LYVQSRKVASAVKAEKPAAKPKATALPRAATSENKIVGAKTVKLSLLHPAIVELEEKQMAAKDKYALAC